MATEHALLSTDQTPTRETSTVADHHDASGNNSRMRATATADSSSVAVAHNPGASAASILAVSEHTRMIGDEIHDLKNALQHVVLRLERLGTCIKDSDNVSTGDVSCGAVQQTIMEMPRPTPYREREGIKRLLRFTIIQVLEPHGLEPVQSLDDIELMESTVKCMNADSINTTGYLERHVLPKLVAGDDVLLQLRGNKLERYVMYPLIDLLDRGGLCVLILVSRLEAQSSKNFMTSLSKYIEIAGLQIAVHAIPQDKNSDLDLTAKSTPNKPTIFLTTPEMVARMKTQNIIKPESILALVVYEAEYVLRTRTHIEAIRSALDEFESCQLILACRDGTEDVLRGANDFSFSEDALIFSMDSLSIHSADHYYLTENALVDAVLDRAVELSKGDATVVVICRDAMETSRLKDVFAERTQILTTAKTAESNGIMSGLLVTPQIVSGILENRPHNTVRMIVNLSRVTSAPDRYLQMLASYMDLGERCVVISRVEAQDSLRSIEALGVSFEEITDATQL
ncbi:hypothetical protein EDD21DRAFT_422318 [Dissophora ornata]|nr:hypothetical protein EDD21DRAFT_422318 [Dissophora ornata]